MSTVTFIKYKPVTFPDAWFLSINDKPLETLSGECYLYIINRNNGHYRIYSYRDDIDTGYETTQEEYDWILAHPEEVYTELLL